MKKWEYFYDDDLTEKDLNTWGEQGWELVTVIRLSVWIRHYFKRELNDE